MQDFVRNIRQDITIVPDKTGIYVWWFDEDAVYKLIFSGLCLVSLDSAKFSTMTYNGKRYHALYLGQAKKESLRKRAKWHICQSHSPSSIKSGYLSTLRQTLSSLLNLDFSQSETSVNDMMDVHCILEWICVDEKDNIDAIEHQMINAGYPTKGLFGYFPLNIKDNHSLPKEWIQFMKQKRREHRK